LKKKWSEEYEEEEVVLPMKATLPESAKFLRN
jgi:hypothetical protein